MKKWKLPKRILAAALAGSLLLSVCAFAQDSQETTAVSGETDTSVLTDEQVSGETGTAVLADGQDSENDRPFTDVQDESQYYYIPVYWGYDLGVTAGTSATTFSPNDYCTRAQFVTFLYALANATGVDTTTDASNCFTDVSASDYYYNSVLWAADRGITAGTSATTFTPNRAITREEAVTMMYAYAGGSYSNNPFTDVVPGNYSYEPILWAYENGITAGTSATTFSPTATCTRAMMITFLYKLAMLGSEEDETLVSSFAVNMNGEGTLINDEMYDELYAEGSAAEGILAIIEAGNFVINGYAMPGTEEDYLANWADTGYLVNVSAWVSQNEDGTWTTSSSKAAGPYDTVAEACLAILTVKDQLNGQDICLYDTDGDGYVDTIELSYVSAIIVNGITDNGDGTYSVDSGYIAQGTVGTEKPYDDSAFSADSDWVIKAENFDDSIELGDVAIFYYGTDGWVLTRALEITGVLTEAVDHDHYTVNGTEYGDAMKFSRDNLVISNRNGEYANAYMYFGMDELEMEVSLWLVPTTNYPTSTGAPIGITSADASASLTEALKQAQAKLDSVVVSDETGASALEEGTQWVNQETYDQLKAAIDRASEALEGESRADLLDYQVYLLYLTLHGSADDIGASFAGYNYEGFDNLINTVEAVTVSIDNDGSTKITDAVYDEYFEGTAAEGVEALLNAGACYVNGIQVPATADEVEDGAYCVDGVKSLYLTDEGWGYNVHKTTSLGNDTFDVARMGFYETLTTVRGHVTQLTLDADGNVIRIDVDSYEVVLVNDIVDNGDGTITIKRGEFDLETNRVRVDIETIAFPEENVDSEIQVGDIAYYYYGVDGWVIARAIPVVGTVTKDSDGAFVVTMSDGSTYTSMESNVSRYNLCDAGRPTQFYNQTYIRLGLTDQEVNVWCTPNGYPIGFTFADPETALAAAIEVCKQALEGVVAAEDEEDVPEGTQWAFAEDIEAFEEAIAQAEALAANESATAFDYSWGVYELGQAYGQSGSNPSGFIGSLGTGTGAADVTLEAGVYTVDTDGSTKITDETFDQYFEGTAAEGVEALLNAGACYVNGIQVPAAAPSTSYQVNGVNSLYETDEGWGYNVHKTTSLGNDTFDDARMGFFETISTVMGHEIEITIGEDGVATKIDISSYESVLIESINWYNESTQVSRGDFELETNRVRLDINDWSKVVFYTPYVASAYATTAEKEEVVQPGMVAYYWYGIEEGESKEGWHLEVANAVVGTLSKNSAGEFVVTQADGTEYASLESNVSRYNLYSAARPTQFYNQTYTRLGLTDQEVNVWCTPNGYPIGFTFANPKAALKEAIENAQAAMADVVVAESEEEVEAGVQWAFQEDLDAFEEAIAAAKKVYNTNSTSDYGYAAAIYELGQAYGQGGSSPSGFIGSLGTGTLGAEDTGSGDSSGSGSDIDVVTGEIVFENNVATYAAGSLSITDAAYDEYYETTAAEGVEALLNAGMVTINGYTVPAEETTTVFKINGNNALYVDEDGTYAYKLYEISEATGLSFQAARLAMVEAASAATGMVITLTAGEDGYISSIEMSMISVARITDDAEHGGQSEYDCGVTLTDSSAYAFTNLNRDFYVENILTEIDVGDIVLYWCQNGTWYIETAQTVSGTLTVNEDGKYVINGVVYETADVWRANLFAACDPDTFYAMYEAFGLADEGIEVTAWLTDGGAIAGFTFTSAKAALKAAVTFVEADEAAAEAIADAVSTAKKTANANSTAVYAYEPAALTLYEAYAAVK